MHMTLTSPPRVPLLKGYVAQMTSILRTARPDLPEEEIMQLVQEETKASYMKKAPTVQVDDQVLPVHILDKYILSDDLIVAGSGSLYAQHEGSVNIIAAMIGELKRKRSAHKKEKFKYLTLGKEAYDKGDLKLAREYQTLETQEDQNQLTTKIFNNSLYGVMTEPNSTFYNPDSGPSITLSGQDITTTAVVIFEKFLANNLFFETITDIYVYVHKILQEDLPQDKVVYKLAPSASSLAKYLLSKVDKYSPEEAAEIEIFIANIDPQRYNQIYYKNNLSAFFTESNVYDVYMKDILAVDDFLDPNEPAEELEPLLQDLWKVVSAHVFYNHQDYYRFRNMESTSWRPRERKAVLTIECQSPL